MMLKLFTSVFSVKNLKKSVRKRITVFNKYALTIRIF